MNRVPPLIMDSGATFLYNKHIKKDTKGAPGTAMKDKRNLDFSFYESDVFLDFREAYIKFVRKYDKYLLAYVNMDWINNAEGSYKSLKYMESKGCHPLPVFHLGNDIKWLKRYVDEDYKFICIGGITPNPYEVLKPILDRIWSDVLTDANKMPLVKVHGLACTGYRLLKRYPWYSVDSTTWTKLGAWGGIYVPQKRGGKFGFDETPYGIQVSERSSSVGNREQHLYTIAEMSKGIIEEWLELINIPMGNKKIKGVTNDYECRMTANLRFYDMLSKSLPKWPWPLPFSKRRRLY